MEQMITRASSINRALDQIGDKWCLLIIQEVFWGINTFSEMRITIGASNGVLADRLKWLVSIDCLRQSPKKDGGKHLAYHLTAKTIDLYDNILMAMAWERRFFSTPELDRIELTHLKCGQIFAPQMRCRHCNDPVNVHDVSYKPSPGATGDIRQKKVRRRSSIALSESPSERTVYKNLINLVGDRWTANVIALTFHGLSRFDDLHRELPIATNVMADRLKLLVKEGILEQIAYQQNPVRYEYVLTEKGEALYPYFLTLLQWGDKWCAATSTGKPVSLRHKSCEHALRAEVKCSECDEVLKAREVHFDLG